MGELKSAWEIAQERASRLGKLSPEEERRQKEEECRQIGSAIAIRWLNNAEKSIELDKYPEEQKGLIKQAVLKHLIEAIELKNPNRLERIRQGIAMLYPGANSAIEQITQLAQEYEGAERKRFNESEGKGGEILHQMRISGTAVGEINSKAVAEWQKDEAEWTQAFVSRLDNLKQELYSALVRG